MRWMTHWGAWMKRQAVLCIAALCALLSIIAVPPDAVYWSYLDLRVLCLLFCLMAVVLGVQSCGVFAVLAQRLLAGKRQLRILLLLLVMLPFFVSMLVTNDVALIAFIPFTILVLRLIARPQLLIRVIVLQTIAANLGSMATPVGNPQNLFLYSQYDLSAGDFFGCMLLPTAASLILLAIASVCIKNETLEISFPEHMEIQQTRNLLIYFGLFVLCLLAVFHLISYVLVTGLVVLCFLVIERPLLKRVDYGLLATFLCFFIFAGNIGRIPVVTALLSQWMGQSTLFSSVVASQVISNVPAAILLSNFTEQWNSLLLGVNIGGLGTPIASLASLISLKFYLNTEDAHPWRFLGLFTLANGIGLLLLLPLAAAIG